MRYQIYANQGYREFVTLATVDDKVLIEYEMPQGTSALKVIPLWQYDQYLGPESRTLYTSDYKGIPYSRIPQYWVNAMVAEGTQDDMIFYPQQLKAAGLGYGQLKDYQARYEAQILKAKKVLDTDLETS